MDCICLDFFTNVIYTMTAKYFIDIFICIKILFLLIWQLFQLFHIKVKKKLSVKLGFISIMHYMYLKTLATKGGVKENLHALLDAGGKEPQ